MQKSKPNPFNIKNKTAVVVVPKTTDLLPKYTPGVKKYAKKQYTPDQIRGLLKGYIEVPKDKWADIPVNSHVRYFKNDGVFARGGFVTNHWLDKKGKPFIHLATGLKRTDKKYFTWPVAHENVKKIFKKPDAKSSIEMEVVRKKTAEFMVSINKIVSAVKEQKMRIDHLEKEHKRILSTLQRLAEKK
jgi:hypothetical protein